MTPLPAYWNWEEVPENLKTKTTLKRDGLRLAPGQEPVAVKRWRKGDDEGEWDLYDISHCVPKATRSAGQQAATARAMAASLEARTCRRCRQYVQDLGERRSEYRLTHGLCPDCWREVRRQMEREEAANWAGQLLQLPAEKVLLLDTETCDLYGEIIDLAIINVAGATLYNRRFNPISEIQADAQRMHGLSKEMLAHEVSFGSEHAQIAAILAGAEKLVIYNADFDTACLRATCRLHGVATIEIEAECLMEWYAQYYGEWSSYHGSYRWQALYRRQHTSLGACQAALALLQSMAARNDIVTEDAIPMNIYAITNPSDPYTLLAPDLATAVAATILLGNGNYGLKDDKGERVLPVFVLESVEEIDRWFIQQFGDDPTALIKRIGFTAIADCLDTVLCGEVAGRQKHEQALKTANLEGRQAIINGYAERNHPSSLNNIGAAAKQLARQVREIAEKST